MSTTTPINGLTIPTLADVPNIETAIHPFANAVDTLLVPRFSTTTARNTAIPSPSTGMICFVTGTGELYKYNGSAWVGASPRGFFKSANESVTSSTTLQDDNHLLCSVEANSTYLVEGFLMPSSQSITPDIKIQFAGPTSSDMYWSLSNDPGGVDPTLGGTSTTPWMWGRYTFGAVLGISLAAGGIAPAIWMRGYHFTAGTSGTFKLTWAQNTSSATATTLLAGSFITLLKVA